jgi:hypothetical protein
MARQPVVEVDGNQLKNIKEVRYGVRASVDRDGAPTRGLECDGIMIRRVADDATDLVEWASSADQANRKSGKITFQDENGLTMKELEWKGGYLRNYAVEYDDAGDHAEEVVLIEPEELSVGGSAHDFDWMNK